MEPSAVSSLVDREALSHEPGCSKQPSTCVCRGVFWIWAKRSDVSSSAAARADGRNMSGKWMLFPKSDDVDDAWRRVCELLAEGKLGDTAKVAPKRAVNPGQGTHLICVYTSDWSDVADVFRVLCTLRDELRFAATCNLNYKTDEATHTAQYSNPESAIRAGFEEVATPNHRHYRVSLYASPNLERSPASEAVQMVQNNIGAEYRLGVVAERVPVTVAAAASEHKVEDGAPPAETEFAIHFYSPEELRKPKRGRGADKSGRKKAKVAN